MCELVLAVTPKVGEKNITKIKQLIYLSLKNILVKILK